MMKLSFIFKPLTLFIGFIILDSNVIAQNNFQPETDTIDFGNVYDDVAECRYELQYLNSGKFPLTVEYPEEFFTDYQTTTDTIAPGDTGVILIRCKTEYRGNLNEIITIETNEIIDSFCTGRPIYQKYDIYVFGKVKEKPHPELETGDIDFGIVDVDEDSGIRLLKCWNEGEEELVITSIETLSKEANITIPKKTLSPGEFIYVKFDYGKLEEGNLFDVIYIETNEIDYRTKNSVVYLNHTIYLEGKGIRLNN